MKKLLCLHGYSMNERWFGQWMAQIQQHLQQPLALVIPCGPHECSEQEVLSLWQRLGVKAPLFRWRQGQHFCWFRYTPDGGYQGVEKSLSQLRRLIDEQGPFDGVFGWSQGAVMSLILQADYQLRQQPPPFAASVFGAGGLPAHAPWNQVRIDQPSLHVIGREETLHMRRRADELFAHSSHPTQLLTPAGHQLPLADNDSLAAIAAWIDKNISFSEH